MVQQVRDLRFHHSGPDCCCGAGLILGLGTSSGCGQGKKKIKKTKKQNKTKQKTNKQKKIVQYKKGKSVLELLTSGIANDHIAHCSL